LREGFIDCWKEFFLGRDQEESLGSFRQKASNILKSREYSHEVKEAVARGLAKSDRELVGWKGAP
jgi:hypothetical protein